MIIRWGFDIPQPDDKCHLSVWYSIDGAERQHAITYHVFYCDGPINPYVDILEKVFPGRVVEFTQEDSTFLPVIPGTMPFAMEVIKVYEPA